MSNATSTSDDLTPAAIAGAKIQAWIATRDPTAILVVAIILAVLFLYSILSTILSCFRRKPTQYETNQGFRRLQNQLDRPTEEGGSVATRASEPLYQTGIPYDAPVTREGQQAFEPTFTSPPVTLPQMGSYDPPTPQHQPFADSRFVDPTEHVLKRGPGSLASRKSILRPFALGRNSTTSTTAASVGTQGNAEEMKAMGVEPVAGGSTPNYLGLPSKVSEWSSGTFRAGGNLWRSLTTKRDYQRPGGAAVADEAV